MNNIFEYIIFFNKKVIMALVDELKELVGIHTGAIQSFTEHKAFTFDKFSRTCGYRQLELLNDYKLSIHKWRQNFLSNIDYEDQINCFISELVSHTDTVQSIFIKYIFIKYIQRCNFNKVIDDLNKNTQEKFNKLEILNKLISDLLHQIQLIVFVQNKKCPKFVEIDTNIKNIINEIRTNFGHMSYTYQQITMEESDMIDSRDLALEKIGVTITDSVDKILDNITDLILIWYGCKTFSLEEYHNRVDSVLNGALTQYFEAQKKIIIMGANSKITNMHSIFQNKKHLLEDLKLPCGYPISSLIGENFDIDSNIRILHDIHTFAHEYEERNAHEYEERDLIELIQYLNIVDKLQSMDLTIYQKYLCECDYKINIYAYWKQYFPDVQLFQHAIVLIAHKIHYDNLYKDKANSDDISFILSSFLDGSFDLSSENPGEDSDETPGEDSDETPGEDSDDDSDDESLPAGCPTRRWSEL